MVSNTIDYLDDFLGDLQADDEFMRLDEANVTKSVGKSKTDQSLSGSRQNDWCISAAELDEEIQSIAGEDIESEKSSNDNMDEPKASRGTNFEKDENSDAQPVIKVASSKSWDTVVHDQEKLSNAVKNAKNESQAVGATTQSAPYAAKEKPMGYKPTGTMQKGDYKTNFPALGEQPVELKSVVADKPELKEVSLKAIPYTGSNSYSSSFSGFSSNSKYEKLLQNLSIQDQKNVQDVEETKVERPVENQPISGKEPQSGYKADPLKVESLTKASVSSVQYGKPAPSVQYGKPAAPIQSNAPQQSGYSLKPSLKLNLNVVRPQPQTNGAVNQQRNAPSTASSYKPTKSVVMPSGSGSYASFMKK